METSNIRVWAEEQEPGHLYLTWEFPEDSEPREEAADRRAVAAALHVHQLVKNAKPEGAGVLVRYDAEHLEKSEIATILRSTLAIETPFKDRASDVLKRVPTYLNLAQKLALDSRISPLPDAAQSMTRRPAAGLPAGLPMQMIPGFRMVSRVQAALPALQSLASWSQDAEPEVVEGHLASAGLTREQLELDHAAAQEMMFYARDFSGEKAAQAKVIAGDLASQASVTGKQWWEKAREMRDDFVESRATPAETANKSEPVQDDQLPEESLVESVDETGEA